MLKNSTAVSEDGRFNEALLGVLDENRKGLLAIAGRIASWDEAEEVVQDATAKALMHRPTNDPQRLLWWLMRVTANRARDVVRKKRPLMSGLTPNGKTVWARERDDVIESEVLDREGLARAADAISRLSPHHQETFLMRASGNLSRKSIAELTGRTQRQVKRDLASARAELFRVVCDKDESLCEGFGPLLRAYAGGLLNNAERTRAKLHLMHCGSCRSRWAEFKRVESGISLLIPPALLVPGGRGLFNLPDFFEGILARISRPVNYVLDSAHTAVSLAVANSQAAVSVTAAMLAGICAVSLQIESTVSSLSAASGRQASIRAAGSMAGADSRAGSIRSVATGAGKDAITVAGATVGKPQAAGPSPSRRYQVTSNTSGKPGFEVEAGHKYSVTSATSGPPSVRPRPAVEGRAYQPVAKVQPVPTGPSVEPQQALKSPSIVPSPYKLK